MGGRGTFAKGKADTPYTYRTVGRIEGIKVLEGMGHLHDLPMESHSSSMYARVNQNGQLKVLRFYDGSHRVRLEIAYHPEAKLAKKAGLPRNDPILHYHSYWYEGDKMTRDDAEFLTPAMRKRYKRLFGRSWK